MAYRPERGWGFGGTGPRGSEQPRVLADELEDLRRRIGILEQRAKFAGQQAAPANRLQSNDPASSETGPTSKT
jgi:hypothetical protein